jgi:hypothetical protein
VVFQFTCGIERDSEEATEFAIALLAGPFDDIRRHRHSGSDHLTSKGRMIGSPDSSCDPVRIQGHDMSLLPDQKLFEIGHA